MRFAIDLRGPVSEQYGIGDTVLRYRSSISKVVAQYKLKGVLYTTRTSQTHFRCLVSWRPVKLNMTVCSNLPLSRQDLNVLGISSLREYNDREYETTCAGLMYRSGLFALYLAAYC